MAGCSHYSGGYIGDILGIFKACANIRGMHECACPCESGGRGGTQYISLVNFNPDSVSGKRRMGTRATRESCQHKMPHFC